MIYLASTSPRRKELLSLIINNFEIISPCLDEKQFSFLNNSEISRVLSKYKAYSIYDIESDDCVISADTVVILKNKILGKPTDKTDAVRMLRELSNKKHIVITSYCILFNGKEINRSVKTEVYFNNLTDEQIQKYIESNLWIGKAGAYGIQDKEFNLINKYVGSYYNVVGLPLEELKKDLKLIGVID